MPTNAELFFARKEAIKDAAVSIIATVATKSKIISRFVFDVNADAWVGLMRSPLDLDENSEQRVRMIQIHYKADIQGDDAANGELNQRLTFGIDFFHGYDIGTDADNSELRLVSEVSQVQWALASSTDLGMNEVPDTHPGYASVMSHGGLNITRYNLNDTHFGAQPVQYALGELEVRMQRIYVRGQ